MEYRNQLEFRAWLNNESTAEERETRRLECIQAFYTHGLDYEEKGNLLFVIFKIEEHELSNIQLSSDTNQVKLRMARASRNAFWHKKIVQATDRYIDHLEGLF